MTACSVSVTQVPISTNQCPLLWTARRKSIQCTVPQTGEHGAEIAYHFNCHHKPTCLVCVKLTQSCSLDPNGEATKVEVLVLGAGIAGIAAARTLEVNGIHDFVILEATDRIGGRIRKDDGNPNLQLGAHWIQGIDLSDPKRHPIWREWVECDENGPIGSPTPDITLMYDESGDEINTSEYQNTKMRIEEASEAAEELGMSLDPSEDISLRQALTMAGWSPMTTLDNFTEWHYVDFCTAIRPEELSVKLFYSTTAYTDFLGQEPDAETEDYLITDRRGYSFVVDCMARNFNSSVKLNTTITAIQTADDCVCVTTDGKERYCGDYGIVTFSIGALQAAINEKEDSVLRFESPLPDDKQDTINSVTLVHYGKIHLIFNSTFLNETEDAQQIIAYVDEKRGYYAYYLIDKKNPNTIAVDITENLTIKVSNQAKEETITEVMEILMKVFGPDIPDPLTAIISNWTNDPFFRCTYTAFKPGLPANIFDDLLEPVGRLYFAGESLNHSNYGFTQGAYGNGVHVAKRISSKLRNCEYLFAIFTYSV